jgi:hypothetical protein
VNFNSSIIQFTFKLHLKTTNPYFYVVRRIFSVLVLLIATWQIVGFFTYFEWEHYHIRKDIKHALKHSVPENQLKNFDFTNKEIKNLTWIKSNEFKLNGRYYDVIKRIPTKNGFHFKCIDDFQETELFQKLEESTAVNLNNSSSSSPLKHWLKLLKTPFLFNEMSVKPIFSYVSNRESSNYIYHFSIKGISQIPVYLPPKV